MGDVLHFDRLPRMHPEALREAVEIAVRMLAQEQLAAKPDEWLKVSQVVERTGVTHCTVRGWIRDGQLKATHWGRSHTWRVRAMDLQSFLKGEH